MKKFLGLCLVLIFVGAAHSQLTVSPIANATCWGAKSSEFCLDGSGNVFPTVNNAQTSGSTTYQWKDVETAGVNTGGAAFTLGAAGAVTSGAVGTVNSAGLGNATAPSQFKVVGSLVFPPSQIGSGETPTAGIYVSTTIPYLSSYELLTSSGAAGLIMTSIPTISTVTTYAINGAAAGTAVPDGSFLILGSTNAIAITLQTNGLLPGTDLDLCSATEVISSTRTASFTFNKSQGMWNQNCGN